MSTFILSKFPRRVNMDNSNFHDALLWLSLILVTVGCSIIYILTNPEEPLPTLTTTPIVTAQEVIEEAEEVPEEEEPKAPIMSDTDIIAMVVMAEAGNQDMLGKVAVATVVLNRADYFGTTVESVVKEPNQFSFPYYGTVSEDCYRAVEIAQENRDLFPATMMYFRNTKYHSFGTPYENIGDHYFSLREE